MENKNKLKFNIVDVIFLLVLLAGLAFVGLRFIQSLPDPEAAESDPVTESEPAADTTPPAADTTPEPTPTPPVEEMYVITFFVPESADYIVNRLRLGSDMTDDSITLDLGTLVDYETGPARISSAAADGHLVISDKEGYSSVYLMCKLPGIHNGFGVTVCGGSLRLEVGHSMVIRTWESKFWAYVYDIQKLEDTPYAEDEDSDGDDVSDEDGVSDGADVSVAGGAQS